VVFGFSLLLAACGSSAATKSADGVLLTPPGPRPSTSALMVCSHEASIKFASALGVTGVITDRRYVQHLYSCVVRYRGASFMLKMKELGSNAEVRSYFGALRSSMQGTQPVADLGDASFQAANGDLVVRKGWGVLSVDVAGLPPTFGVPPSKRADIAYTIAYVIVKCWSGA